MPVEKSGQNEFDFQYGADFGAHIEDFDPDFSKVLVRYNPDDPDAEMNERQLGRLKELADWLHDHDRKFLFELLVPATEDQLASVDGDADRYDAELRPELMRRAIEDCPGRAGSRSTCGRSRASTTARTRSCSPSRPAPARAARACTCVLLGRGASTEKVEQWLAGRRHRRGLHRLRHRPLDLVGRAQGLPRRGARPRGRRRPRSPTTTCISSRSTRARRSPDGSPARGRTRRCVPRSARDPAPIGRLAAWR